MPGIIINGPAGRIEARYSHSKTANAPLALVLHPDPERGGTMNHRIPYSLYQTFVAHGFSTARFNFRGVGGSQGVFDKGEGELSDAAAVLDWMQALNVNAPYVWVTGFGFGAWIGMQLLMRRPEIKGFVAVSPPANEIDFSFLAPCPQSGLIVQGNKDNIVPEPCVEKVVQRLNTQKGIHVDYRVVDGANHFYNDRVDLMIEHVHDYLNQRQVGTNPVPLSGLIAPAHEEKSARMRKKAA
jgi:alpha/beta superfamily hydrolase